MIFVNDATGRAIYHDPVWKDLTGQDVARSLGTAWLDCVHPADRTLVEDTHFGGVEARSEYSIQYRLLDAEGRARWVYVTATPSFGPSQDFLGFAGSTIYPDRDAAASLRAKGHIQHPSETLAGGFAVPGLRQARKDYGLSRDTASPSPDLTIDELRARLSTALMYSRQARRNINTACAFRTRVTLDAAVIELARELKHMTDKDI